METLLANLRQLKLATMAQNLEMRNRHALEKQISYLEFLELLIEDEIVKRQSNGYQSRLKESRLDTQKILDSYDLSYQPDLDRRLLFDLASCRFIEQRSNAIFMGKPGVGKTHLAHAIGLEAVKRGKKVLFAHTNEMVEKLFASRADGSYQSVLQRYLKPDLLILDELGFKKMPQNSLEDFFEIVRRRYETGSMIITTNRNFEDWGNLFGDRVIASAIIDRIVHHATIVKLNGNSYRVKNLIELQDLFPGEDTARTRRGRPRKQENEISDDQDNE
ncbi:MULTISPECIES: IS21-like element helper ATPase IstB [unclassified Sphingobacterium]|uniref:IS21-like element helper ATPase IstB n=1 Tax=unclassified Sphingobacterium TaxID=2609468 RepID=UPI0025ECF5CC|nr:MULTISPECIES: IS21-like element helper ATPase IstB [unclassified Sphingobacterium]